MRTASVLCSVASWIAFTVALFFQLLLILTLWMPPFFDAMFPLDRVTNPVNAKALPFLVTGTVLFLAGYFLFRYMRRGRWIWFAAMAVGAVMLAGVGLYLKNRYPETVLGNDQYGGYNSAAKLVWRHFTPAFTLVFHLLAVLFCGFAEDKKLSREAITEIQSRADAPKWD